MSHSFLNKFFLTAAAVSIISPSAYAMPETLSIHIKTSHYMDMGQQITRIAVGNSDVATVLQLPGSASEFLIVTKNNAGSTALFVWTADNVRHEYLIVVSPEDPGQAMLIEKAINLPNVHVKMVNDRILLTGTVENQYEKNYALQTARLFVDGTSENSILVGSGFDMKLDTSSAQNTGRGERLELNKFEDRGKIIDLLQILHPTQIKLEAQIIEINSEDSRDLGIEYGADGSGGIFYFGEYYNQSDSNNQTSFEKPLIERIGKHMGPINATIHALVTNGKARILSRPNIVTLSGEQATIQIGGEIPYTTTNANGSTNTAWKDYGIILQFKPVVDAQNRINSMVHAEVSSVSEERVNGLPIITTRSADSVINLPSGFPIVIGGLMNSEESKRVSKIPLLGDIPILGEFFKHTSKIRDKRELIVVVTPYLVSESENSQTQISETMREWYEQDQEYRETLEKKDFKEQKVEEPKVEEPPPRILPPSRLKNNNQVANDKKNKSKPKTKDDVVIFRPDGYETSEPFK